MSKLTAYFNFRMNYPFNVCDKRFKAFAFESDYKTPTKHWLGINFHF